MKSGNDQDSLTEKIAEWQRLKPEDNFYFRRSYQVTDTDLLFVHQTEWQRKLLSYYGNSIFKLDATYKTTKYALQLYFICVKTNSVYIVTGTFITQSDSAMTISETLTVLQLWNSEWQPKSFMMDKSTAQTNAVKDTFGSCIAIIV